MKTPAALLAVTLALARPAFATGDEAADAPAPVARGSDTPRNAAYTFIVLCRDGQWADAALMLQEPANGWPERATPVKLARALKGVLDQRLWLDFAGIPGGETNEPGEPTAVTLGIIESDGLTLDVELIRTDDRWEFSAGTVEGIPAMARTVGVWWVASLPEAFVNLRVAEIELWQWIGLLAIAIAGLLVGWAITATLRTLAARVAAPAVIAVVSVVTPLVFLLSVMGMRFAQPVLVLSAPARASLSGIIRAITVLVIAWMITRWLRVMAVAVEKRLARQGIADGASIVRIGRGVAIALTWMLGAAAALQTFGLDLSAAPRRSPSRRSRRSGTSSVARRSSPTACSTWAIPASSTAPSPPSSGSACARRTSAPPTAPCSSWRTAISPSRESRS
jgi:MscS family membrane protein